MTPADQLRISLVLLPSGATGRVLLDLAVEWADYGLLQRSLWIQPEDVTEDGPISATLVQGDGSVVDRAPFRMLSRFRLEAIQVLVLQTPARNGMSDPVQAAAADRVKRSVTSALPQPEFDETGIPKSVVEAVWVNLIAAPSRATGFEPKELALLGFTTLVAAPEDRRAPGQLNGFVEDGVPHLSWALAQAASILGLWMGVSDRPLAEFEAYFEEVSAGKERADLVLVYRSYVRIVTAAEMARERVSAAMQSIMGKEANIVLPSTAVTIDLDPAERVAQYIDALTTEVVTSAHLEPFEPTDLPSKERISVPALLGSFFRFSRRELKALPREWYWRIMIKLQRWIRGKAEGKDGEIIYEVVVQDDVPPDELFAEQFEQRLKENSERLRLRVPRPPSSSVPRTWQIMRSGAFALLDGSPMPSELKEADRVSDRGRRSVLSRTEMSVPKPEPWVVVFDDPRRFEDVVLEDAQVNPGDPETADDVLATLDSAIEALRGKQAVMADELKIHEAELQQVSQQLEDVLLEREVVQDRIDYLTVES